jgi:hypothetical protein
MFQTTNQFLRHINSSRFLRPQNCASLVPFTSNFSSYVVEGGQDFRMGDINASGSSKWIP